MTIAEQAASDIVRLLNQGPLSRPMLEFEIARIVEDAILDAVEVEFGDGDTEDLHAETK